MTLPAEGWSGVGARRLIGCATAVPVNARHPAIPITAMLRLIRMIHPSFRKPHAHSRPMRPFGTVQHHPPELRLMRQQPLLCAATCGEGLFRQIETEGA